MATAVGRAYLSTSSMSSNVSLTSNRPAVRHPGAQRGRRDAARQHAAGLHDEAPALGADLRADRPVQTRRDRVERVLHEGAVDGRAAAVPDVRAEPAP